MKINNIYNKTIESENNLDKLIIEEKIIKNEIDFAKLQYFGKKIYRFISEFILMDNYTPRTYSKEYSIYINNFPLKYLSFINTNISIKTNFEISDFYLTKRSTSVIQVLGINKNKPLFLQVGKIKYMTGLWFESDPLKPVEPGSIYFSISLILSNPKQYQ